MSPDKRILILGSGPAGISAAQRLVTLGVPVKLVTSDKLVPRHLPEGFEPTFPELAGLSPKVSEIIGQQGIYAFLKANRIATQGFSAQGALCAGGLSKAWGVVSPFWREADFKHFPFGLADLAPHYQNIIARVPWSGTLSSQEKLILKLPDTETMPVKQPLRKLIDNSGELNFRYASGMVGLQNKGSFQPCQLCNGCFSGCRYDALYSADLELKKLSEFDHFELATGEVVTKLMPHGHSGFEVEIIEHTGHKKTLRHSKVLVALGALASTRLIGNMLPVEDRPVSIQNTPAVAFAFSHPKSILSRLESDYALAQLSFETPLKNNSTEYAFGTVYPADGLSVAQLAAGSKIPRHLLAPVLKLLKPSLYICLAFLPGHYSQNSLQFDDGYGDKSDDNAVMKIRGRETQQVKEELKHLVNKMKQQMSKAGFVYVPGSMQNLAPGGDSHYGASLPMGQRLTRDGEVPGFDGLHIIDGAALSDMSSRHPTLTIMANADRIASAVATRMSL